MHLRTDIPGDMMRGLSYSFSSYTALLACQLAELGATGPRLALEGKTGFLHHASGSAARLVEAFRDRGFRLTRAAFKEFSSSGGSQPAVRAAVLASRGLDPARITRIVVRTNSAAASASRGSASLNPVDKFTADHNLAYAVASAVVRGDYRAYQFEELGLRQDVQQLMSRVLVEADTALDRRLAQDRRWVAGVEITSDRGTRHATAEFPPERRLDASDVSTLFRRMTAEAVSSSRATAIIELTLALETAPDLRALTAALAAVAA